MQVLQVHCSVTAEWNGNTCSWGQPNHDLVAILWHSWDAFAEAQVSRFCGWTRRSLATLCAWVVLLVVEACTSHAGLNCCAACEHMSSVGVGVKRHSMLHALLYTTWVDHIQAAAAKSASRNLRTSSHHIFPWLFAAGTFLGLARLLTSATSFEDALDMAAWMLSYPWLPDSHLQQWWSNHFDTYWRCNKREARLLQTFW